MSYLFGGLIWLVTGNPLLAIGVVIALIWLAEGRARGRFFNPAKFFSEWRQMRHLEGVLRANPHDRVAHLERGRLLLKFHKSKDAIPHLEQANAGSKGNAEAAWLLGRALLNTDQLAPAKQALALCWSARGRDAFAGEPLVDLGAKLVEMNQYREAVPILEEATAANSSSAKAFFWLGRAQGGAGEKQAARETFAEAISLAKDGPRFKRRESWPWAQRSRLERARLG